MRVDGDTVYYEVSDVFRALLWEGHCAVIEGYIREDDPRGADDLIRTAWEQGDGCLRRTNEALMDAWRGCRP
jgi:hypothetical protein